MCQYDCAEHECVFCGTVRSHDRAVREGPCLCNDALISRVYALGDEDGFQVVAEFLWAQL